MEKKITLTLTEQEVQSVLSGLAKFPFEQVAPLINNLASQVQAQIQAPEAVLTPELEAEKKKG